MNRTAKTLIFDFGKVLVDYDFRILMDDYLTGLDDVDEFCHYVSRPEFLDICDREQIPWSELMEQQKLLHPHWKRHWELFDRHYTHVVTGEIAGMYDLLTRLRAEGYRLYGLSNWCTRVYEVVDRYPIFSLLEGFLVSCDIRHIKPEPEIYEALCRKYDLDPADCIFIDDKQINVDGALAVGMDAVLFRSPLQLECELRVREATSLFMQGFNCAQAVAGALAHPYVDTPSAMALSAGLGGGIGRMRLVCGAAQGMFLMAGCERGQTLPDDQAQKSECYRLVQDLAADFRTANGSLSCAELLAARSAGSLPPDMYAPTASARTAEYYAQRPCLRMICSAVRIYYRRVYGLDI